MKHNKYFITNDMNFKVLIVVLAAIATCYANLGVPALLFSSESHQFDGIEVPSAGQITPTEKFSSALGDISSTVVTVIFRQDEMASEDFIRRNPENNMQTVYPQLSKLTRDMESLYFPAVNSPAHALKSHEAKYSNVVLVATEDDPVKWLSTSQLSAGTLVVITLPSTTDEENLVAQLTKIDTLISSVLSILNERKLSYTAIYTGFGPRRFHEDVVKASSRHLLATNGEQMTGSPRIVAATDCFCLVLDNLKVNDTQFSNTTTVDVVPISSPCGTSLNVTLNGPKIVDMTFELKGSHWAMTSLSVDGTAGSLRNSFEPIRGYQNQSYHCLATSNYILGDTTISFTRIQVEPFCKAKSFSYAYPNDCIGIFTGPLLASLFVSLILLSITCIGTGLLANVASNDRFDDPKGTPLAVTVSE